MVISSLVGLLIAVAIVFVVVWALNYFLEPPAKVQMGLWLFGVLLALLLLADFFGVLRR